jgi:molybdopterin converting factor small subunit
MLPKKGRREITVNGVLYHYKISRSIYVIIRNSVTSEIIKWYEERKPKWKIEFKPSDVENIIINHNNNKNEN